MLKYKTIAECNLEGERLERNISVAVTPSMWEMWHILTEFYKMHNINMAENIRQAILNEMDALNTIRVKHLDEVDESLL